MISIPPGLPWVQVLGVDWLPLTCHSAFHYFISGHVESVQGTGRTCHGLRFYWPLCVCVCVSVCVRVYTGLSQKIRIL